MTILSTKKAKVNGKVVTVETLHGGAHKQDIQYKVDGVLYAYNDFWGLKPKFITSK